MKIETNYNPSFRAASDITLEYALKKHSKFLPKSFITKARELISCGKKDRPVYEVHNEIYKDLFEAESLSEVKAKYPEFSSVEDIITLESNRSKAIKAVKKIMPLEKFTLSYLKKLYQPTSQDKLKEEFGFTNRSLLGWLNKKLHINKLSGSYIKLIQMSDEKENRRIAELSRNAIYADAEAQKHRLERAAEAHKTPEYRAKKRQEMKDYYERNPEKAKKTGLISKLTWSKCPEIRAALSEYTKKLSPYIRKILSKKRTGAPLNAEERRIASSYYKQFWEQNPQLKEIYRQRRLEAIEELGEGGVNNKG